MKRKKILKMKLLLTLFMFIFSGGVGSFLWSSSTWGTCRINDISLEKEGNFTKLTIYADKPFEFVHSTAETEDGKPYRVIIDCQDAIYNLPQHNFIKSLPPGTIKAIRTSQFQTEPEKIVRIVLDLNKPAIYKVVERGEDKKGAIAVLTAQDLSFPFWTAGENVKTPAPGKLASSVPLEKATQESFKSKDTLLTSSGNNSRPDLKSAENVNPQEAEKKATFERPLSFADTSEINAKKETLPVSMAKPEPKRSEFESTGKDVESGKKGSEQTSEKVVLATAVTSPEVFSAPNQKDQKLQSEQEEDKKGETTAEKEASGGSFPKPSSQGPLKIEKKDSSSLRQAPGSDQSRTAESQKPSLIEDSERSRTKETSAKESGKKESIQKVPPSSQKVAISSTAEVEQVAKRSPEESRISSVSPTAKGEKEPIQKKPPSSHKEAISSASEAEKVAKEPKEESETKAMNPAAEEKKLALLSSEEKSIKEKTVPPESLIVFSKPEGTELEVVFQRKVVYYHGEDGRDPFAPLTGRISTDFGKIPLPMFESLKLVGVLKDEEGNRALLEDEKGYGYILKSGDKIKNGYVVSVEDNKVIFQIEEYGWSKTIALELSTEY
jgi:Tfp pilus assembly protein PilP